jgi:hypothetical protein
MKVITLYEPFSTQWSQSLLVFLLPNGVSVSHVFIEQCLQGEHDLFIFAPLTKWL